MLHKLINAVFKNSKFDIFLSLHKQLCKDGTCFLVPDPLKFHPWRLMILSDNRLEENYYFENKVPLKSKQQISNDRSKAIVAQLKFLVRNN